MIFDKPPEDFSPDLEAAACYIEFEGKILLLKRKKNDGFQGRWGQPGGRLDNNEKPFDAIKREVYEETGIRILNAVFLKKIYVRYSDTDFVFYMFREHLKTYPEVTLSHEHSEYKWISPSGALELDLLPDEAACIKDTFKI